ncbi:MAG: site-2 protease family protein [Candidatus Nitrosothermus koennekii]|nr:MAG: site-2 protease family protein [Candidatus Nitrosothermus koennekii]
MVSIEGKQPLDEDTIISVVAKYIPFTDYYSRLDGSIEFVTYEMNIKDRFKNLIYELSEYGLLARVTKSNDHYLNIIVFKEEEYKSRIKPWMPFALFIITTLVVFYDGIVRSQTTFAQAYISDPIFMAILYVVSFMGILGVHEMGHMLAAKKHGVKSTWPLFIPGIPGLFVVPPTFGAIIFSRGNMINRDVLFDVGVSGPIAGLIITIIVSIYGASISPLVPEEVSEEQPGFITIPTSLLMMATFMLTDRVVEGFTVVLSPVAFAAWVGFIVTFLNLIPAWQLDGGHITRAALGRRWHVYLTFTSIIALAALGYIFWALFILLMSSRMQDVKPLDDVSPLSKKRKIIYAVTLILAGLCAPMPQYLSF